MTVERIYLSQEVVDLSEILDEQVKQLHAQKRVRFYDIHSTRCVGHFFLIQGGLSVVPKVA